jgi:23S rRNA (pseudouridine1915-N3)-methyltransferase
VRILVAAVGRLKGAPEEELAGRYLERASALGRSLALGPVTVAEVREGSVATAAARKADEARRLLRAGEGAGFLVALDERGRMRSSAAFADLIRCERDKGSRLLAFLVGGPDGHGDEVLGAAGERLSLGPMTLPHGLARIVLIEQIYRAVTIISGHPYHRA